jgi:hypothetical protein
MIHEQTHIYAMENNIPETSKRGTYHNKHFKKLRAAGSLKMWLI